MILLQHSGGQSGVFAQKQIGCMYSSKSTPKCMCWLLSEIASYTSFLFVCVMSLNRYVPVAPLSKKKSLHVGWGERERIQKLPSNAYREAHNLKDVFSILSGPIAL